MRATTWAEFKKAVEDEGVVDSTTIKIVDYDPNETFSGLEVRWGSVTDEGVVITNEGY